MPQFLTDDVRDIVNNPTPGETVELVVGVDEGHLQEVEDWVSKHGGEVERTVGFDMILLELPEEEVAGLSEHPHVDSMEFNDTIEVLSRGNRYSPSE